MKENTSLFNKHKHTKSDFHNSTHRSVIKVAILIPSPVVEARSEVTYPIYYTASVVIFFPKNFPLVLPINMELKENISAFLL